MLSLATVGVFRDILWLELLPFLYFMLGCHRIVFLHYQSIHRLICYRLLPSASSGTPCDSSYRDALWLDLWSFLYFIGVSEGVNPFRYFDMQIRDALWLELLPFVTKLICYRLLPSASSETPCGSSYCRFCILC